MNRLVGAQLKVSADLFVGQSILLFDVSYDKQPQYSEYTFQNLASQKEIRNL
jgi:hypothetical protein